MNITKYETNKRRNLFMHETFNVKFKEDNSNEENKIINIYPEILSQNFLGFGGALTGSTCYNLLNSVKDICNQILDEYFLPDRMNYNLCRISIGSSDFNLKSYSYSNKNDLSDFSIAEDMKYVIPVIKEALKRNSNLEFLASCWSPPSFMKDNKKLTNGGKLLPEFKEIYSEYLVKFIKTYKAENININYLTIQNEPMAKQIWESCIYSPEEEMDLIVNYIYPKFKINNINTKILIWDHNKDKILERTIESFKTSHSIQDVSGIAFHWYTGDHFENIELLRKVFPDKLLFHTEGCTRLLVF